MDLEFFVKKLKHPKRYSISCKLVKAGEISFEKFGGKTTKELCITCGYGKECGNCPSEFNNYLEKEKKKIRKYKQGILVVIKTPSSEAAGDYVLERGLPSKSQKVLNEILVKLKQELLKEGHTNTFPLTGGPCKSTYCPDKKCSLLTGDKCRHPKLAFPAMEAFGINVFKTVENAGYKMYWIDKHTKPTDIPYALKVGLLLFK